MISIESVLEQLPASVTASTLVGAVRAAMEAVERYADASGAEKKAAVLECLQALVNRTDTFGEAKEATLALLPHLIDELVVVSRDGLRINQRHSRLSLRCFCAALRRLCRQLLVRT